MAPVRRRVGTLLKDTAPEVPVRLTSLNWRVAPASPKTLSVAEPMEIP